MSIKTKRFIAYVLDIVFIYVLLSLITSIRFINPTYEKYNDAYTKYTEVIERYYNQEISIEEMQELNEDNYYDVTRYSISNIVVIDIVLFLYFVIFQKYNNGQTLGKKIMKLKVVTENNKDISIGRYFLRILPMYFIFIGNFISLIINGVLVFILNSGNYSLVSSIITYIFLGIGILDLIINLHDRISHTKVELVEE